MTGDFFIWYLDHSDGAFNYVDAMTVGVPYSARIVIGSAKGPDRIVHSSRSNSGRRQLIYYPHPLKNGKINLIVEKPDLNLSVYKDMFSPANEYSASSEESLLGGLASVQFRRPPIPPSDGFNLFGDIADLELSGAKGQIMVGSKSFPLDPPAKLKFSEVTSDLKDDEDAPPSAIPIQVKGGNIRLDNYFTTKANLTINGDSVTKLIEDRADEIGAIALGLAILGTGGWLLLQLRTFPFRRGTH